MAYRDDYEALAARCAGLERDLAAARAALEDARRPAALPLLDNLRIASPCRARWSDMDGDERVRFCGQCSKHVYNLSALSRAEAERLVRDREGELCVRFFRRADGTVLTSDCPVGLRRLRWRRAAVVSASLGFLIMNVYSVSRLTGGAWWRDRWTRVCSAAAQPRTNAHGRTTSADAMQPSNDDIEVVMLGGLPPPDAKPRR